MAIWLKDVETVPLVSGRVSRTIEVEAMRIVYKNRATYASHGDGKVLYCRRILITISLPINFMPLQGPRFPPPNVGRDTYGPLSGGISIQRFSTLAVLNSIKHEVCPGGMHAW